MRAIQLRSFSPGSFKLGMLNLGTLNPGRRNPGRFGAGAFARWGTTVLAGVIWSGAAVAAPFCLQNQGMVPQCIYYDPTVCQHDAQKQNAECGVNPKEVRVKAGTGQYCLVTPARVSDCHYQDMASCLGDARRQNGACTGSPSVTPTRPPDPYSRQGY